MSAAARHDLQPARRLVRYVYGDYRAVVGKRVLDFPATPVLLEHSQRAVGGQPTGRREPPWIPVARSRAAVVAGIADRGAVYVCTELEEFSVAADHDQSRRHPAATGGSIDLRPRGWHVLPSTDGSVGLYDRTGAGVVYPRPAPLPGEHCPQWPQRLGHWPPLGSAPNPQRGSVFGGRSGGGDAPPGAGCLADGWPDRSGASEWRVATIDHEERRMVMHMARIALLVGMLAGCSAPAPQVTAPTAAPAAATSVAGAGATVAAVAPTVAAVGPTVAAAAKPAATA